MAGDVQVKIISANNQNTGAVAQAPKACGTDAHGSNYVVSDEIQKDMTDTEAFNKYDLKFVS